MKTFFTIILTASLTLNVVTFWTPITQGMCAVYNHYSSDQQLENMELALSDLPATRGQ